MRDRLVQTPEERLEMLSEGRLWGARSRFRTYRRLINPHLKDGWFRREIEEAVQRWWERYKAGDRPVLLLTTPPQHGKLLADETPVLTTQGWKLHGDLVPGDEVFGLSGKAVRVLAVSSKASADMKVTLSNGETLFCHERHEWTVYDRRRKCYRTVETGEMMRRGLYWGEIGKRGSRYLYKLPLKQAIEGIEKPLPPDVLRRMVSITSIERVEEGRVGHCIMVDAEDGLYLAGRTMQPTHNSILIIDFISWIAGQDPTLRTIFGSYSDRLGVRANLRLQRIFDSEMYRKVFPETRIGGGGEAVAGHQRNREIIEYIDKGGFFRNVTAGGSITGDSLDVGIIDDPVKGREEANSDTMREKIWEWYTDDFSTRFSDSAGLLLIMTRWHIDDIAARILEHDPTSEVLNFEAIAEHDEPFRMQGEPLFPDLKSLEFLERKKRLMRLASWKSLYQGSPIIDEGNMFRPDAIRLIDVMPKEVCQIVRYWDKAGTEDGGAFTAGAKLCLTEDDRVIIADITRDQLSAGRREQLIRQTAGLDGVETHVWVEQEPGSGGKESAENTIKNLIGYVAKAETVTGSKAVRAEPFAAYVEAGNVLMLRGSWNKDFLDEMRLFPNGKYKDQIDAASGAFNKMTLGQKATGMLDFMRLTKRAEEAAAAERESVDSRAV